LRAITHGGFAVKQTVLRLLRGSPVDRSMKVTRAVWFQDHKYPPSTSEQVLSWWADRTGNTFVSREAMEAAQKFVDENNRDTPRPTRCHAPVLQDGRAVRCAHKTVGLAFCLGEYYCQKHLPRYTNSR